MTTTNTTPVNNSPLPTGDVEARMLAKVIAATSIYIEFERDDTFDRHLDYFDLNRRACIAGHGARQRALYIMGESGTGKTKMVRHHLAKRKEFQPYQNEAGHTINPVLFVETPAATNNTKSCAIATLAQLGISASDRASEFKLYDLLKRQLKFQGIQYIVFDEAQQILRGAKAATVLKVQDVMKSLLQIEGHPVHIIFVGTPALARFLDGDRQLANRSRVMRLLPLNPKKDMEFVKKVIHEVILRCELTPGWGEHEDVGARLVKAASNSLGTLAEILRDACFIVLKDGRKALTSKDLAIAYRERFGALNSQNVFKAKPGAWENINPAKAVSDLVAENEK
ncbi:TniB family NTP-binding protein [Rhizobium jaguaris]|nr:TniB family NTP-binding protein [Rhizobium jaguaris]